MSQKTDKMLKLALVFFISLLSFSIGTFVGKKYSDNQHKLAELEPTKNKQSMNHDFATTASESQIEKPIAKDATSLSVNKGSVASLAIGFSI